jgi:hypothetical protein
MEAPARDKHRDRRHPRAARCLGKCRQAERQRGARITRNPCASDIDPVPISWLWHRTAIGKQTLIAADVGLGKSQLTALRRRAAIPRAFGKVPRAVPAPENQKSSRTATPKLRGLSPRCAPRPVLVPGAKSHRLLARQALHKRRQVALIQSRLRVGLSPSSG